MPQRVAAIEGLPMAFEVVKAMQAEGLDWGEGYRGLGRQALREVIETEMAAAVDHWLRSLEAGDAADRRSGYYRRSLLTELGDIVREQQPLHPVAVRRPPLNEPLVFAMRALGVLFLDGRNPTTRQASRSPSQQAKAYAPACRRPRRPT